MMRTITKETIVIKADGTVERRSGKPSLEQMIRILDGGYIQMIPEFARFEDTSCEAYCDEEGKLKNLPLNKKATALWHYNLAARANGRSWRLDELVGTIIVVKKRREKQ